MPDLSGECNFRELSLTVSVPYTDQLKEDRFEGPVIGHFRLGQQLGKGTFANVYHALDWQNNCRCAVKHISKGQLGPRLLKMVEGEVKLQQSISDPHVIRVIDTFETPHSYYIVFELAEFGELFRFFRYAKGACSEPSCPGLPESACRHFLQQIADGVSACHQQEVIHRDIKLENIVVCRNGVLKLTDFGLAIRFADCLDPSSQTICGSRHYIAPEVLRDKSYSSASDLWAVGVLLYALAAGRMPFAGNSKDELYYAIRHKPFAPIKHDMSPQLTDLLNRLLNKNEFHRLSLRSLLKHPWMGLSIPRPVAHQTRRSSTKILLGRVLPTSNSQKVISIATPLVRSRSARDAPCECYWVLEKRSRTTECPHGGGGEKRARREGSLPRPSIATNRTPSSHEILDCLHTGKRGQLYVPNTFLDPVPGRHLKRPPTLVEHSLEEGVASTLSSPATPLGYRGKGSTLPPIFSSGKSFFGKIMSFLIG
jgi:serine/threonine protein kinase